MNHLVWLDTPDVKEWKIPIQVYRSIVCLLKIPQLSINIYAVHFTALNSYVLGTSQCEDMIHSVPTLWVLRWNLPWSFLIFFHVSVKLTYTKLDPESLATLFKSTIWKESLCNFSDYTVKYSWWWPSQNLGIPIKLMCCTKLLQIMAHFPILVNDFGTLHFRNLELNEQKSASGYPMMSQ